MGTTTAGGSERFASVGSGAIGVIVGFDCFTGGGEVDSGRVVGKLFSRVLGGEASRVERTSRSVSNNDGVGSALGLADGSGELAELAFG